MIATSDLERDLYRVIDNYIGDARAIHRFHSSHWNVTEIEVRPLTLSKVFEGNDTTTSSTQAIARIEGMVEDSPFLAVLQVRRSERDCRDIESIEWHIDSPEQIQRWLVLYHMKGKPGLLPSANKSPLPKQMPECWAWDHLSLINCNLTPAMSEFSKWIDVNIPVQIRRFYLDRETAPEELMVRFNLPPVNSTFWGVFALCDLTMETWQGNHLGNVRLAPGNTRYKSVPCDVFQAINWFVTGAIRLSGAAVHAYHDDEELGCQPISPSVRTELEQAQDHLRQWLQYRWGKDRLEILLDRIGWSRHTPVQFFKKVSGHDVWRQPHEQVNPPSVRWFLPYP